MTDAGRKANGNGSAPRAPLGGAARSPIQATIPYYGGKWRHLRFILRNLPPPSAENNHLVDAFGGSGVVVVNTNYRLRTYNDANRRLVTMFRVLRDKPDLLIEKVEMTPYSRAEFLDAGEPVPLDYSGDRDVEEARRFLVRICQVYDHIPLLLDDWTVRRQFQGGAMSHTWVRRLPQRLAKIVERLRDMQIECMDGIELVRRSDRKGNVVYLDPPYPQSIRNDHCNPYGANEMSEEEHRELVEVISGFTQAKVALSSYRNPLYERLGWRRTERETYRNHSKRAATECLYMNYDPPTKSLLPR